MSADAAEVAWEEDVGELACAEDWEKGLRGGSLGEAGGESAAPPLFCRIILEAFIMKLSYRLAAGEGWVEAEETEGLRVSVTSEPFVTGSVCAGRRGTGMAHGKREGDFRNGL